MNYLCFKQHKMCFEKKANILTMERGQSETKAQQGPRYLSPLLLL